MPAKYGYTVCHICQEAVSVRPITADAAIRKGYDSDRDGQYLAGKCSRCHGAESVVYELDIIPAYRDADVLAEAICKARL